MKKILVSGLAVAAVMVLTPAAQAQISDITSITARMQAIISQMQALQSEFAQLQTSLTTTVPSTTAGSTPQVGFVLGAMTTNLQEVAVYGATNDTITKIQRLLATDPDIYPDGTVSGFFGPKTEAALKELQGRYGMNQVGVVGPETAALLAGYFTAHPDENYPEGLLKTRPAAPTVLGVSTAVSTPAVTAPVVSTPVVSTSNPIETIYLRKDDGEIIVRVVMKNGRGVGLVSPTSDEDDVVEAIADKVGVTEAQVREVLDISTLKPSRSSSDRDEGDAEDKIDDAKAAIEDAENAIDEAKDDGEDTDDAEDYLDDAEDYLDDAEDAFDDEDYDEAYDLAKDALNAAEDALDALGGSNTKSKAKDAIEDAESAIEDAEDAIDEAKDDDEDTDDAEDLLEEAKDALDDAEEAYDDGDYEDALDYAEEAEELANDAEDEL